MASITMLYRACISVPSDTASELAVMPIRRSSASIAFCEISIPSCRAEREAPRMAPARAASACVRSIPNAAAASAAAAVRSTDMAPASARVAANSAVRTPRERVMP